MQRCKALLFLAVIIALVTVVPVMAECTVRPKGCTQLVDGEEVYVKFWTLQDCIDIMGPEYEDSCIIDSRPLAKNDGDLIEKEERSKTHHSRSSSIVPPSEPSSRVVYNPDGSFDLFYRLSKEVCLRYYPNTYRITMDLSQQIETQFPEYFNDQTKYPYNIGMDWGENGGEDGCSMVFHLNL